MTRKLGAIPTPPDVRDYTIQVARAAYPDAWEIPIPKHYDQQASTCVPQTMRWLYYLAYGREYGVNYLYAGGRSHQGEGMVVGQALSFLVKAGNASLKADPKEYEVPEAISRYNQNKAALQADALPVAGCVWARATTVSQVKAALTAKRKLAKGEYLPVSATLAVEQWDPDSRGVWPCSRPGLGYHQVLIKGWKKLGSKEYALIHNSWGQNWGMNGDALVEWDEALALGAYVLVPPEVETQEPEQSEPERPKARRTLRRTSPYMRDEDGYTDVSLCQTRLDVHGFSCGAMDGIYGPKTEAAVRSFQGAMGLDTDGICGSKTWAALDEEPGEEATDPETPTDVEEPVIRRTLRLKTPYMRDEGGYQDVSLCQTRLAAHGFPCGEVDGIYGPNTEWAVRSFQAYSGLDADGICGSKTWAALDREPTERPRATAAGLVDFVKGQVGQVYVWGGHGQYNLTDAQIRSMDTSHANAQRSIDFIKKLKTKGVTTYRCFDCSGLISRYLYDLGLVPSKRNCNHLAGMCGEIHTPANVSALEAALRPGDLVFRKNSKKYYHVGVYIGGGQVVEAKGRDDGVVQRRLDASGGGYWNRWGRLRLLEEAK